MRQGVCRHAQRDHPPGAGRTALRSLPGVDILPAMPRSAVHDRMPRRVDPAAAPAEAPAEKAEQAGAQKTENPSAARLKAAPKKKATTCDLCSELSEPSCVYACPHDAAFRVD